MMNTLTHYLFMSFVINFFVAHAMETAPVILGQRHIVKFLNIVNENRPFEKAVPHIKQLAERKQEWKQILDDSKATGELITWAYENYEKDHSYTTKAEMAFLLGTMGACSWCKNHLLTNEWEVKCLTKQLLRAAESDDRDRISAILNVGIDINATDPGSIDDGSAYCIGGFNPVLISAIERNNTNLVEFLLVEKCANPNIRAQKGELTPLIMSIQLLRQAALNKQYENFYKNFSILCLLMKHNLLDLGAIDSDKKTALDYATEYGMDWLQAMIALRGFKIF